VRRKWAIASCVLLWTLIVLMFAAPLTGVLESIPALAPLARITGIEVFVWLLGTIVLVILGLNRALPGMTQRRRTDCPACAYDCRSIPPRESDTRTCPECGTTLPL